MAFADKEAYRRGLEEYYREEIEVIGKLDLSAMAEAMAILEKAREEGRRIFICGNGGSAATASHFCCDFNKGVSEGLERGYDFECLGDNVPTMMAVANDISYDDVFVFPLSRKMREGDVFVGISGSGNSENVVRAAVYAKEHGGTVIAITGYSGGRLAPMGDVSLHVPVDNMQITEDLHMTFDHSMMFVLSKVLKG